MFSRSLRKYAAFSLSSKTNTCVVLMDNAVALAMSAFAEPTIPLRRNLPPSEDKLSEMFWVCTDCMYRFKNGAFDTMYKSGHKDNQCLLRQMEKKKAISSMAFSKINLDFKQTVGPSLVSSWLHAFCLNLRLVRLGRDRLQHQCLICASCA